MVHRAFYMTAICITAAFCFLVVTVNSNASDDPPGKNIVMGPDFTMHNVTPGHAVTFMVMNFRTINIFVCNQDGSVTRLQTEQRIAKYPSPSNDGGRIYFESAEDIPYTGTQMTQEERELVDNNPLFQFQIYTLNNRTGHQERISDGNSLDSFPVASPDGSRVAFCSRLPNRQSRWKITLMDHDGSDRYQLNPTTDDTQLWPAWSPDGKKIVYVSSNLSFDKDGKPIGQKTALLIHDLDTRHTRRLQTGNAILNEPNWSPSGDWICFTEFDIETASYSLWKISIDGTGMQQISEGPEDRHASWFPDGKALVFARGVEQGAGNKEICMIDIETGKITKLISASNASLEYPHVYAVVVTEKCT